MILIVTAVFPPESVVSANLSYDIANALATEEEVVVLSPPPSRPFGRVFDKDEILEKYPFEHIVLDSYICPKSKLLGRFRESISFGIYTKKYIEKNHQKIEAIYANTWPLFAQKYLVDVASSYKIPLVLHVHDIYPELISEKIPFVGSFINKLLLPMDRKILNNSTEVVTISYKMKEYLSKSRFIESDKITVVRNWQNDDIFIDYDKENGAEGEIKFIFMYLGSISPTAGVDLLVNAFGKADLDNAMLIIAGDGTDKDKCMKIVKDYQYKEIHFCDVMAHDVPEMQAKADVLMLPLKNGAAKFALPSKLTAYLLSAKPIIASIDIDSEPANIIRDNDCGYLIEPENEDQLINCMYEVSRMSREKLSEMGKKGFIYAKENLTRKYNLSKILTIIKKIKRDSQ